MRADVGAPQRRAAYSDAGKSGSGNTLWDGGTLSIGRRTSESFKAEGARLTVSLLVQEPTLLSFLDKSDGLARGIGFLARVLVSWPESTQGYRPYSDPPDGWPAKKAFNGRIAQILANPVNMDEDGRLTPTPLRFDPDAKAAWIDYLNEIEGQLAPGRDLYDVRDVASKSADNAARLAAIFHIFEHGSASGRIGVASFESASRIAMWHLLEARRFFGELALPSVLRMPVGWNAGCWITAVSTRRSASARTTAGRGVQVGCATRSASKRRSLSFRT